MTQHVELDYTDPVHQGFFDPIQELLGAEANPNFKLVRVNSTTIKVAAGTGDAEVGIAIKGRYRFRTTETTASLPALPDGEHPIFATASDNDFTGPLSDIDEKTDYTFGLQIKKAGETPGTALYREVGKVVVAGGAITALKQTAQSITGAQLADGALISSSEVTVSRNADGALSLALTSSPSALIPSGTILPTARKTAPAGYLLCDGSAVSRTTYATLWEAIKESGYGTGDGSTTFNLPDFRGRVPVGVDTAGVRLSEKKAQGESGGLEKVALTETQVPPHYHPFSANTGGESALHYHLIQIANFGNWCASGSTSCTVPLESFNLGTSYNQQTHFHSVSGNTGNPGGGSGVAHGNMQPFQTCQYMIKI